VGYENAKSDKMKLLEKGDGSFEDLKSKLKENEDQVIFGYSKVVS
jgi:hypothetical protein